MATSAFCSLSTQKDEQVRASMKEILKCEGNLDNKNLESHGRLDYLCSISVSIRLPPRLLLFKIIKHATLFTLQTVKLRGKNILSLILAYLQYAPRVLCVFHVPRWNFVPQNTVDFRNCRNL
jgi:hypothetical protein